MPVDSIGPVFRDVLESVAATAGHPIVREQPLPPGTTREIRAYLGFGITAPHRAVRIWEDRSGVYGWLGLWWQGARLPFAVSADQRAAIEQEYAGLVKQLRQHADNLGCRDFREGPEYETCTLPLRSDTQWSTVLRQLDSLGISRLPHPPARLGFDGTTLVVEIRDAMGYRAYSYWSPQATAEDPDERAAAAIVQLFYWLRD